MKLIDKVLDQVLKNSSSFDARPCIIARIFIDKTCLRYVAICQCNLEREFALLDGGMFNRSPVVVGEIDAGYGQFSSFNSFFIHFLEDIL